MQAEADPLPLTYVVTSKWFAGAPHFSVYFSDWDPAATIADADLSFTPDETARALDPVAFHELVLAE